MKKGLLFIITGISVICNIALFIYCRFQKNYLKESNEKYMKFKKYYQIYNCWISSINKNISIESLLKNKNLRDIAIYGNGEIGNRLYESLQNSDVRVHYFIDKKAGEINFDIDKIKVYDIRDITNKEKLDAIIVTPVHQYEEIKEELQKITCETMFISVEEIFI